MDLIKKYMSRWIRINPVVITISVYFLFLIPLFVKDIKQIQRYYKGERINVKGAVKELAAKKGQKDIIVGYGLTTGPLRYYVDYYNIPRSQLLILEWEKGDGTYSIHRLLKAAKGGDNIWYIFGGAVTAAMGVVGIFLPTVTHIEDGRQVSKLVVEKESISTAKVGD